jgi:hypothetical protein
VHGDIGKPEDMLQSETKEYFQKQNMKPSHEYISKEELP